jgi:MFS family permease
MALKMLSKDGFYGWTNLVIMFFFNLALMPMLLSFSYFLPSWKQDFAWNLGTASWAQTISIILSGITAPVVAIYIMKKGSRRAIVMGNSLCVLGLIMLAFQNHIWQLFLGVGVFIGLGMSLGGMLAMMTITNNWFVMKRTVALSLSMASMGFSGIIIGPSIMGLIHTVGWRNTYLILAAAALLFCVVLPGLFLKNKPEDLGQVPDGPMSAKPGAAGFDSPSYAHLYKTPVDFTAREALRTPALWLLVAFTAIQFLVMGGSGTHIIKFQEEIGISAITAGLMGSLFSAVMGISQLGMGFLGLRIKMHSLAVYSMLLGIVGFSTLLFAKSVSGMILYSVIFGISSGVQAIAMGNLIPDYFGRTNFPKIMGYTMPFSTFVSSVGAPIAGYFREATGNYMYAFKFLLALLIVAFFCILFAKPPKHPSLKTGEATQPV